MKQIKRYTLGLILLTALISGSCHGDISDAMCEKQLPSIILVDELNIEDWPHDWIAIDTLRLSQDILSIDAMYCGGSHNNHDFLFIGSRAFIETDPPRSLVFLSHEDNDDFGESLIRTTLNFDLTPLKQEYEHAYGQDHGTIILSFLGLEKTLELQYTF